MPHFVYLLECADGSFYCGYTVHLEKRILAHNKGTGAKYTRGRRPVKLVYQEKFSSRSAALKREAHIKSLSRKAKQELMGMWKKIKNISVFHYCDWMKCAKCGKPATKLNKKGISVCSRHVNVDVKSPACPECKTNMVIRQGKFGLFWGCQAFPMCDGLMKLWLLKKNSNKNF